MTKQKLEKFIHYDLSGCWLWTGTIQANGYGVIAHRRAHRVAYEAFKGPIPEGLQLDHLCRVRRCVNPDHLEPVTNRENFRRGLAAGFLGRIHAAKTHCPKGHEYNKENTLLKKGKDGFTRRNCRECSRLKNSIGKFRHKPMRPSIYDAA